jgi:GDP-mannose 6-dehydrogenase
MRLLAQDTKLNLSRAYLEPGFAYGGPCLPKDLRALLCAARQRDLDLPLLEGIEESNAMQIQRATELVLSQPGRRIGILGLAFKAGTDDLRESPVVPLVEALLRNGGHPRVYDPNVNVARVSRTHHQPTRSVLARFSELMVPDAQEIVDHADVLVIGNRDPGFADLLANPPKGIVVDLVGLFVSRDDWRQQMAGRYHCLCG